MAAQARAQDAIARVRQLDPSWQPAPSLSASRPQSVEGLIRRYEAEAEQAVGRAVDDLIVPSRLRGDGERDRVRDLRV